MCISGVLGCCAPWAANPAVMAVWVIDSGSGAAHTLLSNGLLHHFLVGSACLCLPRGSAPPVCDMLGQAGALHDSNTPCVRAGRALALSVHATYQSLPLADSSPAFERAFGASPGNRGRGVHSHCSPRMHQFGAQHLLLPPRAAAWRCSSSGRGWKAGVHPGSAGDAGSSKHCLFIRLLPC